MDVQTNEQMEIGMPKLSMGQQKMGELEIALGVDLFLREAK